MPRWERKFIRRGAAMLLDSGVTGAHDAAQFMKDDPSIHPTRVKAPRNARVLGISWADGHEGTYPHDILRGYCPCAGCQGHSGTIRFIPGGELEARFKPGGDLELRNIEQVGNYALRFEWGDAHGTGIYTFRYLRSLCQCDACTTDQDRSEHPERPRL